MISAPPDSEIFSMLYSLDDAATCSRGTDAADGDVIRVRLKRPSLLDPYLPHEPNFAPCVAVPNVAVLYLMNRPVAIIQATQMDFASLDSCLAALRMRAPRPAV
jgi:hypothetical protein